MRLKASFTSWRDGDVDVVITEIGGTVGDIESQPFLEAIRQFSLDVGKENCLYIHLTLVPYLKAAGELKTKPTQHSVGLLRQIGIQPDVLICRTERSMSRDDREKIALFCNVPVDAVIEEKDKDFSIYEVPLSLLENRLDEFVCRRLGLKTPAGRHRRLARFALSAAQPGARSVDRGRRQICRASRCLQVDIRIARPRRHPPPSAGANPKHSKRTDRTRRARAVAGWVRWILGSRRIRGAGHRRQSGSHSVCPRARYSVFRNLPGNAVCGDRVWPECSRPERRPTRPNSIKTLPIR